MINQNVTVKELEKIADCVAKQGLEIYFSNGQLKISRVKEDGC